MKILCVHSGLVELRKYFSSIFYVSKCITVWIEISFEIENISAFLASVVAFLKITLIFTLMQGLLCCNC